MGNKESTLPGLIDALMRVVHEVKVDDLYLLQPVFSDHPIFVTSYKLPQSYFFHPEPIVIEGLLTCLPSEKHQPVRTLPFRENSVSAIPNAETRGMSMRI